MVWVLRIGAGMVVLIVLVLGAVNIGPGRLALEWAVNRFTPARIEGLSGRVPDRLRVARLSVSDSSGPWLLADDVALDWSPAELLRGRAKVQRLAAATVTIRRLPISAPGPASASATGGPPSLPVQVSIDAVQLQTLRVEPAVAGVGAIFGVTGRLALPTLDAGEGTLTLTRQDQPGAYALTLRAGPTVDAALTIEEPAGGLLGTLAGVEPGAPIAARATLVGPQAAAALTLDATAGPLTLNAAGTIDLPGARLDVRVRGAAPAMAVAGVRWDSAALDGTAQGPWAAPSGTARLRIVGLQAPGVAVRTLTAEATAPNPGRVQIRGTVDGLVVAAAPGLFAAAPVMITADADLAVATRPIAFTLRHPVVAAEGTVQAAGWSGTAAITLPSLTPLAALAGVAVQGQAQLTVSATPDSATVDGTVGVTAGAPFAALLGRAATIGLTVERAGDRVVVRRLALNGQAVRLALQGTLDGGMIDATAQAGLSAVGVVAPGWTGALALDATIRGPTDAIGMQGLLSGTIGAPGLPPGPLTAKIDATGLPGTPVVRVVADGVLAAAPLALSAELRRAGDATTLVIERARWKSVQAGGTLRLTPTRDGTVTAAIGSLADLAPFLGRRDLAGALSGRMTLAADALRLEATGQGLAGSGVRVGRMQVRADVTGLAAPRVAATVEADGVVAQGASGRVRMGVQGPLSALAVTASGMGQAGGPASFDVAAVVDTIASTMRLQSAQLSARGEQVRLLAPAMVRLAGGASGGVSVDRLRLGARQAELEVSGRLSPTLDATARLQAAGPALALVPGLLGQGSVTMDAKLSGTPGAPAGTVRLQATGLRAVAAPQAPPLSVMGTAQLGGGVAQVDARAQAGTATLTAQGRVPLGPGALDIRLAGALDLAVLEPFLAGDGRRATGRLTLDGRVGGTLAAPAPSGTATLAGASFDDFGQGLRLSDIAGTIQADGAIARVVGLTARAGPGTIRMAGTAGLGGAMPLDLTIQLDRARPLASDRLSADLDGAITIRGPAAGPTVAGRIVVRGAELRIPERLPRSVAVLDVRRVDGRRVEGRRVDGRRVDGQPASGPPAAPEAAASPVRLDLRIDVPGAVFVRGRGLDAELRGSLVLGGTTAAPVVNGGLALRQGTLNAAGTVLNFTRGRVGFDGTGLSGKIDPTLDFVASSSTSAVVASIIVGGYASAPKISFTSVPDLPPDEVLAFLLFKRSAKELGPLQLAQIAAAVAQLTGVGSGVDPLGRVQRGLGLDRLSINGGAGATSTTAATGPSVEGGRYVAPGVYVGAKQGTSGGQTAAQVQIDLAPGLKAQTEVGTGARGSSVGLSYEFEY